MHDEQVQVSFGIPSIVPVLVPVSIVCSDRRFVLLGYEYITEK
jgi:hypothetical protein